MLRAKRTNIIALVVCLVGILAVVIILSQARVHSRSNELSDARFHFTFCAITQGTNHSIFSGNQLLARLNGSLVATGLHPLTDDRMYPLRSSNGATLLSVGYLFDGDGTNPPAYAARSNLLTVALIKPDGTVTPITKRIQSTLAGRSGEHISHWIAPAGETNFAGCKLRFTERIQGKHVATIAL